MRNPSDRRRTARNLRRLLPYVLHAWLPLSIAFAFTVLSVILQLPLPLVTRYIIDSVLPARNLVVLDWIAAGLVGLVLVKGLCDVFYNYVLTRTRERMLLRLQADLFRHVHLQSLGFFKNSKTGYLVSRINNDVAGLGGLLSGVVLNLIKDAATFVVGVAMIFSFHWKLAMAAVAVLPFFICSLRGFGGRLRSASALYQEAFASVWDVLQESLSAIGVIKAFQLEEREHSRFHAAVERRIGAVIRMGVVSSLSAFATAFIGGLGPLLVLWYGSREVMNGNLSLGTLMAFNAFVAYLFGPTQRLMSLNNDVQTSLASLDRVCELFDTVPDVKDPDVPVPWSPVEGRVSFEGVAFGYDAARPVLRNITLLAEPGQSVALVGRSGAGKTSLANLIPRFYDPQLGRVLVDGIDVRHLRQDELRRKIGIVSQETFLFAASIRENIGCGRPDAGEGEIRRAVEMANAAEFIGNLPSGFDTEAGERGARLSGGERQRIAIARAILRNPKILILDEATSEIDAESERLIQNALALLLRNRTTFIIAHRFATVLTADKIVVLDDGRIVDEGQHAVLYNRCVIYRELCAKQFISDDLTSFGPDVEPALTPAHR